MRVVIVGNHAAGLSAAQTLRRRDASCEIVMISKEDVPPYSRSLISYLVSGKKEIEGILHKPASFYGENAIKTMFGVEVVRVLADRREVLLASGERVGYDALILAHGGVPVAPNIPGIENRGVFAFRNLSDAVAIADYCKSGILSAAVLGGGLVGLKAAEALNNLGKKTQVIVGSPNILSQIAGPLEAEIFEEHLAGQGIEIVTRTLPAKILGDGKVEGVETTEGRKHKCQLVIGAKGVKANTGLVEGSGIKTQYGIVVDEHCQTSVPGVYAAGDVTQSIDTVRKDTWTNALWPHAVEEGRVAAENILGLGTRLKDRTMMNSINLYGLPMISCGLTGARDAAPGAEVVSVKGPGARQSRRFVLKDNCLVGFALVGAVEHAGVLTSIVRKGVDIAEVKDQVLSGRFDFASLYPFLKKNRERFDEPEYEEVFAFSV